MTAHVRRVVRGEYSGAQIGVAVGMTSCSHPFMFGREGYIVVVHHAFSEGEPPIYIALEHTAAQH